jgi:predicted enzyme related to lactoylglutathione lyase
MNDRSYGIIISVDNLDRARQFYRETIGLGSPVVDSNHWIEFQLDNGLILGLRHQAKADQQKGSAIVWVYYTTDYEAVKQRLSLAGSDPLKVSAPPVGLKSEVFADPEGNRFALALKPR